MELIGRVVDGVGVTILLVGALIALIPYLIALVALRATSDDYRGLRGTLVARSC
jgi:hypothetical protein